MCWIIFYHHVNFLGPVCTPDPHIFHLCFCLCFPASPAGCSEEVIVWRLHPQEDFCIRCVCCSFVWTAASSSCCCLFFAKLTDKLYLLFTPREHEALQALVLRDMLEAFKGTMILFKIKSLIKRVARVISLTRFSICSAFHDFRSV